MSTRLLPVAPVAALVLSTALLASSAAAQTSVRLDGDPALQHARLAAAAKAVCRAEYRSDPYARDHLAACVKATLAQAVARTGDERLLAYHRDHSARRFALASLSGR